MKYAEVQANKSPHAFIHDNVYYAENVDNVDNDENSLPEAREPS